MADTRQIPRVALPKKQHELPPFEIGRWVLAGSPVSEPYPCVCWYDPCRYARCPDRTRADRERVAELLPPGCCGRADAARPREQVVAEAGFVQPNRRTTWERRFPTARLADVLPPGELMAESDLWTPAEEDPFGPDWGAVPGWDAIDEVSGSHEETLEGAEGHSDTPDRFRDFRSEAEKLWREMRARVAAAQCDCPTPWDTDPPTLLWAAGPKATAPERAFELSAKPGADSRAEADQAIELSGDRRLRPWKQGRHALLPPVEGRKTRECWSAPLEGGRMAVIDLPPEPRAGGVHCPDCHTHWRTAGAYEMHRPKSPGHPAGVCRDPATVRLVMAGSTADDVCWGPPLLKRDMAGVWSVDTRAVWGPDGPPA